MPLRDKTGPEGKGPLTGLGRGGCEPVAKKKWMQGVKKKMEQKGTTGALRRYFRKKKGQKISSLELAEGLAKAKKSGNTKLAKRINLAKTFKKYRKGK